MYWKLNQCLNYLIIQEIVNLKCSVTSKVSLFKKKKKSQNTVLNVLKIEIQKLYKQTPSFSLHIPLYQFFPPFKDRKKQTNKHLRSSTAK